MLLDAVEDRSRASSSLRGEIRDWCRADEKVDANGEPGAALTVMEGSLVFLQTGGQVVSPRPRSLCNGWAVVDVPFGRYGWATPRTASAELAGP